MADPVDVSGHQPLPDYGVEDGLVGPEDESWRNDPYKPPKMPFDCFKEPDLMKKLAEHPHTRPYCTDQGFLDGIQKVIHARSQQEEAQAVMADPRITRAMAALNGWELSISEGDVKRAERVGDAPKRDAVQMPHWEFAFQYKDPKECKDIGNECFKDGSYQKAIACWRRVMMIYQEAFKDYHEKGEEALLDLKIEMPPHDLASTLHSNCAMALLKLERPEEALKEAEEAIRKAPFRSMEMPNYPHPKWHDGLHKAHYRSSQAHEQMAKKEVSVDKAAKKWADALESARAAHTAAKEKDEYDKAKADAPSSTVTHLAKELKRLKVKDKEAKDAVEKANAQKLRDKEADTRRQKGLAVAAAPKGGAIIAKPTIGYVRDIDLSVFSTNFLRRALLEVEHRWREGSVKITRFDENASEIETSIKEKNGKRALYYDINMTFVWEGKSRLGRHKDNYGKIEGIYRMYNIGQDTKFELGGDRETSYVYELGFMPQYIELNDPWASQIKEQVHELFEIVSKLITKQLIPAVESKAELVK